jgi:hypothetical protein
VQKILWGQPAGEAGVLPDLCGGGVLHRSKVFPTGWVHEVTLPLGVSHHKKEKKRKRVYLFYRLDFNVFHNNSLKSLA